MINKASTIYITWKGYEFCLLSDEILFKLADNPPAHSYVIYCSDCPWMLRAIYCIDLIEKQVVKCGMSFMVKLFRLKLKLKSFPAFITSLAKLKKGGGGAFAQKMKRNWDFKKSYRFSWKKKRCIETYSSSLFVHGPARLYCVTSDFDFCEYFQNLNFISFCIS